MPNQLAQYKRRQSLTDHAVVLAALKAIALSESTTVVALLRAAARDSVRKRVTSAEQVKSLRRLVQAMAPQMPARFKTPAQLARFKRAQREYDCVLLDLSLSSPAEVQSRNSVALSDQSIRLVDFDQAHASPAI